MKQIWKLPFTGQAYPLEKSVISTVGKELGDSLKLAHDYFSKNGIEAQLPSGDILSVSDSEAQADIILINENVSLSKVIGYKVYKGIRLNTSRVLNTSLSLWASYVTDIIDPSDIGQSVNQEADVVHRSMDVFEQASAIASMGYLEVLYHIDLPDGGFINQEEAHLAGETLTIGEVVISSKGITFQGPCSIGTETDVLAFNGFYWERKKDKDSYPLMTVNTKSAVHTGIPIWNKHSPSVFSFFDWLQLEPTKKGIKVPNLESEVLTVTSIKLGKYTISTNSNGDLDIGGVIKVFGDTKKLSVGGVLFDKDLELSINYIRALAKKGL